EQLRVVRLLGDDLLVLDEQLAVEDLDLGLRLLPAVTLQAMRLEDLLDPRGMIRGLGGPRQDLGGPGLCPAGGRRGGRWRWGGAGGVATGLRESRCRLTFFVPPGSSHEEHAGQAEDRQPNDPQGQSFPRPGMGAFRAPAPRSVPTRWWRRAGPGRSPVGGLP